MEIQLVMDHTVHQQFGLKMKRFTFFMKGMILEYGWPLPRISGYGQMLRMNQFLKWDQVTMIPMP